MNKQLLTRISWVDVCRGIGIILVLFGHAIDAEKNRILIYAFHMPLFFFLSGVVFKPIHDKSFLSVVYKNVRQIIVPYFLFAILTFALDILFLHLNEVTLDDIRKQLYGIVYGNGNQGYLAFNVALWFLPCLFVAKVSFAAITKFVRNKMALLTVLIFLSVIGYAWSVLYHDVKFPFGIESAFTAIVFFGMGYLLNQTTRIKDTMTNYKLPVLFFAIVSTTVFAYLNYHFYGHQIDMRVNRLNDYFFFYAGAFSGITVALIISMIISNNRLLEYLGKQSLLLFVWHTLIYALLRHYHIPPVRIDFVNSTFYFFLATSVILLIQMLMAKTKLAHIYKKSTT